MSTATTITRPAEAGDTMYQLLFCDRPELYYRDNDARSVYPWSVLAAAQPSVEDLERLAKDESAESRVQLLAYRRLVGEGYSIAEKVLLGVVIEVGLEDGLDTLAAYRDGTARFLHHTGKMVAWNAATAKSTDLVEQLFAVSEPVVAQIGPWDKERLAPPAEGAIRLSFLVSDGLYFGQGPFEILAKDPMADKVIHAATQLMIFLTEQG